MIQSLIDDLFPHLDGTVEKKLLHGLEGVAKQFAVNEVYKPTAHVLLKGMDSVIAVAVANLPEPDAIALGEGYAETIDAELAELLASIRAYVPLQVAVETAKKHYGPSSAEANAARKLREVGITALRSEVKDVLLAAVGGTVED